MATNPKSSNQIYRSLLKRLWQDYQWTGLGILWVVSLVLGTIGFMQNAAATRQNLTFWDCLYRALQLIPMNSGDVEGAVSLELELARFLIPVLTAATAIKAFASLFRDQVQRLRLLRIRHHIVICGLSKKGVRLVRKFRTQHEAVVVIERDEGNDYIQQCQAEGAIVMTADATDTGNLLKAGVHRARLLIAVCDNDGTNAEIALRARQITIDHRREPLTCIIHLVDPRLCTLLREREISIEQNTPFRIEFFNVFEHAARIILRQYFPPPQEDEKQCPPHLVVVGLGKMGESLVVQAARLWRDRHPHNHTHRLQFTIIDRGANEKCESLAVRYPQLVKVCQITPLQIEVRSPAFERAEFLFDEKSKCTASAIFIALDNDAVGLNAGLTLNQRLRRVKVPIVIRMVEDSGLATVLQQGVGSNGFENLHEFSILDQTCTPELVLGGTHEILARAFHEEYVRSQIAAGESVETNPILVEWDQLSPEVKEANYRQADAIGVKLKAVNRGLAPLTDWNINKDEFSDEEIESLAQMEHERWCAQLHHEGWTYAPVRKDPIRRTNPDLVTWDELPEHEKKKNRIAIREIPAFLARAGLQIIRME